MHVRIPSIPIYLLPFDDDREQQDEMLGLQPIHRAAVQRNVWYNTRCVIVTLLDTAHPKHAATMLDTSKDVSEWIRSIQRQRSLKSFLEEARSAIKSGTLSIQTLDYFINNNVYPEHVISGRSTTIQVNWKAIAEFQHDHPESKLTRNLLVRKCFERPMELPLVPIPEDAYRNEDHAHDLATIVDLYLQQGYKLETKPSGKVNVRPIKNALSNKGWSTLSKSHQLCAIVQHVHGQAASEALRYYHQSMDILYTRDDSIRLISHQTKTHIGYHHSGIGASEFKKDWVQAMAIAQNTVNASAITLPSLADLL